MILLLLLIKLVLSLISDCWKGWLMSMLPAFPRENDSRVWSRDMVSNEVGRLTVTNLPDHDDPKVIENQEERSSDILVLGIWVYNA